MNFLIFPMIIITAFTIAYLRKLERKDTEKRIESLFENRKHEEG